MREPGNSTIPEFYIIGKVKVSVTSLQHSIKKIISEKGKKAKYICVGNVRTIVFGNKNQKYQETLNEAFMNLPDGMPLVWAGRLAGAKTICRTSGPDLFSEMLKEQYDIKHFLLGDTDETLNSLIAKIQDKYPATVVSGYYAPPFKPLEEYDFKDIATRISNSGAEVVWVAVGAPKQDFLSAELVKHCETGIFIGVGAAFRFFVGEYKHPPRIFQLIGLEGVFWRFFKNPVKQFIWYCKHIPQYIWLLTKLKLPNTGISTHQ